MVSRLYVLIASPKDMPLLHHADDEAADQVDQRDEMAAIASPLTNLEAPSIAP